MRQAPLPRNFLLRGAPPRLLWLKLAPLIVPTVAAGVVAFYFSDPTYRFCLTALLLPIFLRAAARALDADKEKADSSGIGWLFSILGFAGFVAGWLLAFTIFVYILALGLLSLPGSAEVLKASALLGGTGFILAAWFWWPWYARDVLAAWPPTETRIWTASGNRWQRIFLSWRMQQLAASGELRWRGFATTSALVISVLALAALGSYQGVPARLLEFVFVALLPVLHLTIVHEANTLCLLWRQRPQMERADRRARFRA